jgi:3-phenylpropionate/cinnamic acid dioxygenase small subunit
VSAATRPVTVDVATYVDVVQWLTWEAELLDARELRTWLSLLDPEIRYRMPVRVTTDRAAANEEARGAMDHFDEDRYSLTKRVERLEGDHAWAEDPPSRTRRFVTNVRVRPMGDDEVEARSYLLLYRSRGDVRPADILSAERTDRLRRRPDGWALVARHITVDDAVLRTQNLALFL